MRLTVLVGWMEMYCRMNDTGWKKTAVCGMHMLGACTKWSIGFQFEEWGQCYLFTR